MTLPLVDGAALAVGKGFCSLLRAKVTKYLSNVGKGRI